MAWEPLLLNTVELPLFPLPVLTRFPLNPEPPLLPPPTPPLNDFPPPPPPPRLSAIAELPASIKTATNPARMVFALMFMVITAFEFVSEVSQDNLLSCLILEAGLRPKCYRKILAKSDSP